MLRPDLIGLAWGLTTGALVLVFGPGLLTLGVPLLLLLALVTDGVMRPGSSLLVPTISAGPRDRPRIALTFDDGPDRQTTPRIAKLLEDHGMRGTFFCIGERLEAHRQLGERLATAGHELGNHSHRHPRTLNLRGPRGHEREILPAADAIRSITGAGATAAPLYRPPIGLRSPPLARVVARLGLRVVTWSLHSRDTARNVASAAIVERVLSRVRPGDIVLFHDGHDRGAIARTATLEALEQIVPQLVARGLEGVTVSELLGSAGLE